MLKQIERNRQDELKGQAEKRNVATELLLKEKEEGNRQSLIRPNVSDQSNLFLTEFDPLTSTISAKQLLHD